MLKKKSHNSWHVILTKPRQEKKVATNLLQLGIEAFCPVRKEIRQWSDRKKKVEVPLLPSMVLVCISEAERPLVFNATGVIRYLFWLGKPAKVTTAEVEALHMIEQQNYTTVKVDALEVGSTLDLKEFGMSYGKGTVKYISKQQCWVVLQSLGFVVKLQLKQHKKEKVVVEK